VSVGMNDGIGFESEVFLLSSMHCQASVGVGRIRMNAYIVLEPIYATFVYFFVGFARVEAIAKTDVSL